VTQQQLARGERLVELLKQGQYVPWPVEEQVIAIFAGTHGYLDPLPIDSIGRYQQELISWLKAERSSILADIVSKGKIDDDLEKQIEDALKAFSEIFEPKQGN
jgi:F-type H+-transporting ATPase subunit alpha